MAVVGSPFRLLPRPWTYAPIYPVESIPHYLSVTLCIPNSPQCVHQPTQQLA